MREIESYASLRVKAEKAIAAYDGTSWTQAPPDWERHFVSAHNEILCLTERLSAADAIVEQFREDLRTEREQVEVMDRALQHNAEERFHSVKLIDTLISRLGLDREAIDREGLTVGNEILKALNEKLAEIHQLSTLLRRCEERARMPKGI